MPDGYRHRWWQSATLKPRRCNNIIQRWARAWVRSQNAYNQVFDLLGYTEGLRKRILVVANFPVRRLHVGGFKWWSSYDHCVQDDSKGPDVDLVRVPLFAFQNFRRDVIGRTAYCALFLVVVFELSSKTEIANFETIVSIQEEVAQLEVAVDHTTLMEVFQRNDEVVKVEHRLWFRKPFAWSFAHEFVQSLARTQLQDDVHEIVVLEIIVEFHNFVVVQRPMDCNL
mmetsp:Transcript_111327/g.278756  ORF Transcript_111327/g.278756 Transcript_111327/m.278756 type:complete len:226 (+) Transcript_111327:2013-2690(+)